MLTELLRLLPVGSQLWIATHSVGMIRRAFDVSADEPGRVAFLDFGQVSGPSPDVRLRPSLPSSQLLREVLKVQDEPQGEGSRLVRLVAPTVTIQESLVLCALTGCQATFRRWWYLPYALVGLS